MICRLDVCDSSLAVLHPKSRTKSAGVGMDPPVARSLDGTHHYRSSRPMAVRVSPDAPWNHHLSRGQERRTVAASHSWRSQPSQSYLLPTSTSPIVSSARSPKPVSLCDRLLAGLAHSPCATISFCPFGITKSCPFRSLFVVSLLRRPLQRPASELRFKNDDTYLESA